MKRKFIYILLCLILLVNIEYVYSQDRQAFLPGDTFSSFFDSFHQKNKSDLNSLGHSYQFYAVFKIDMDGKIQDIEFVEIPKAEAPVKLKQYVTKVIMSSDGKWLPQIKNSKPIVSDEVVYLVIVAKKDQSIDERTEDEKNVYKYFYSRETERNERLDKLSGTPKSKYLFLSY